MAGIYAQWEHPPSSTSYSIRTAGPTEIESWKHTTTLPSLVPTLIDGIPAFVTPTANAAAIGVVGGIAGVGAGGPGAHKTMGVGSLGMITVLLMLYNLCAGLGLGVMLWKGKIDWKGNINDRATNTRNTGTVNPPVITVTDSAGAEWFVPLTWVQGAVQRVSGGAGTGADIANAPIELTDFEGNTGNLRLGAMVDVAVETLRWRAAGLY